jgi:hypothetical protein
LKFFVFQRYLYLVIFLAETNIYLFDEIFGTKFDEAFSSESFLELLVKNFFKILIQNHFLGF